MINCKFPAFHSVVYCVSKLWAIKYTNNKREREKKMGIVQNISHFITLVLLNSQISGHTNIIILMWKASSQINSIDGRNEKDIYLLLV